MRARKVLKFLLGWIILSPFFFPAEVFSQQDVSEYQKKLNEISGQIKELQTKIEEEEKKESTILSRLDMIGFNKKLIRKEITLYTIKMDRANEELASIKKMIPELKEKLEREKEAIEKILVTVYKFGRFSSLQFILQADDVGTLISESKHLTLLAQYQENVVSDYIQNLNQLKAAEDKQETKKKDISRLIGEAQKKRRELEEQERKNRTLIGEIKKNRNIHVQTIEELRERHQKLQTLIKKLLEEEVTFPAPLIPLFEKKGALPWPIAGTVVSSFGPQKHPLFNTTTTNNGIDISPRRDNVIVKSIHPGKVVYADYFQGYGNLIIIDHGLTYYSLYGHLSDILIRKGDMVKAEQPIAFVGDIGSLEGVTLYFEIRNKTKPENPLHWLKRR